MPGPELPRRTQARQPDEQPDPRIPWNAFAIKGDVSAPYGQPSPALIERARRGWKRVGSIHARTNKDVAQ
ncbi:hypothetical protein PL81_26995 [Streptomyces sp. RSD-27]|nr:hypothetical protein PL81_26995 [Streptomyces sp. RSD-27]